MGLGWQELVLLLPIGFAPVVDNPGLTALGTLVVFGVPAG
jgi:hypothetical protein